LPNQWQHQKLQKYNKKKQTIEKSEPKNMNVYALSSILPLRRDYVVSTLHSIVVGMYSYYIGFV
jgi:hypothetical protein